MSLHECIEEIKLDYSNVCGIARAKEHKVQRLIKTCKKFPLQLHSFVNTKRNNRWLIMWNAQAKKHTPSDTFVKYVVIYTTRRGRIAVVVDLFGDGFLLSLFTPHFFQRFALRTRLDFSGEDLIKCYFERNYQIEILTNIKKCRNHLFQRKILYYTGDGIGLGLTLNIATPFVVLKTFIRRDMQHSGQIQRLKEIDAIMEKTNEWKDTIQVAMQNPPQFIVSHIDKKVDTTLPFSHIEQT